MSDQRKREFRDYINDIIEATNNIQKFVQDLDYDHFFHDKKTTYAVVRGLEIIGEASKNIPNDIKENYPDIPWKEITGMRDKIAHEYFGVDLKIVWQTIQEDLPFYKKVINKIKKDLF
jgi:uncharacterized protein with HEPN domain